MHEKAFPLAFQASPAFFPHTFRYSSCTTLTWQAPKIVGRNRETHCLASPERIVRQLRVKSLMPTLSFQKLARSGMWVQFGGFMVNQRPPSLRVLTILLLYHHDSCREPFSNSYYFKALWSSDCLPSPEIPSTRNVSWQLLMNHHYILAGYPV